MDLAALRALIEAFEPADAVEAEHRAAMLELCASKGDPTSRDHFDPGHFTASAFVLSPRRDALLLIFHGKLHRWLQPGGHVDPTDLDIFAAARREVEEECGTRGLIPLGGLFDLDVHVIPARKGDPDHKHFDVRLLFQAEGDAIEAGSDAKAARWVPLVEIHTVESDESVMRAVRKLQGG